MCLGRKRCRSFYAEENIKYWRNVSRIFFFFAFQAWTGQKFFFFFLAGGDIRHVMHFSYVIRKRNFPVSRIFELLMRFDFFECVCDKLWVFFFLKSNFDFLFVLFRSDILPEGRRVLFQYFEINKLYEVKWNELKSPSRVEKIGDSHVIWFHSRRRFI